MTKGKMYLIMMLVTVLALTLFTGNKDAIETTTCTDTTITTNAGEPQHKKECTTTTVIEKKAHNYILNSLTGAILGAIISPIPGTAMIGLVAGFIYAML